jgi:hypothetical protein
MPSLAAMLSSAIELIDNCITTVIANGVHWRTWSALVTAMSHFPKREVELELLGSGCNADLIEDQVDVFCTRMR